MSAVTIITNYTEVSHVLCGDPLKDTFADFRITILRPAEWATWHSHLVAATPFTKGWCIKKENLLDLENALRYHKIPYDIREASRQRKSSKSSKPNSNGRVVPPYRVMIAKAIKELKQYRGATRYAIKKYIHANFFVSEDRFVGVVNRQLKAMVESGELTSHGDRFRIAKKPKRVADVITSLPTNSKLGGSDWSQISEVLNAQLLERDFESDSKRTLWKLEPGHPLYLSDEDW